MPPPIVFDQYQRYHFIRQIVEIIAAGKRLRILETGAASSPLDELLSEHDLILTDQVSAGANLDLKASGLHLPFRDRTFEVVICTDVLEHMASDLRNPFVQELSRVTSDFLIIGFPHTNVLNNEADRIFYDFIKAYSGLNADYLKEHLEFGLPDSQRIRGALEACSFEVLEFENTNIYSWLLLQIGNFVLLQHPEMERVRNRLNEFFAQHVEASSHRPPCYRTFLLGTRQSLPENMKQRIGALKKESGNISAEEFSSACLALIDSSQAAIQQKIKTIQDLQVEVRRQNIEIEALQSSVRGFAASNANLQNYLNLFLQHPVYKIYRRLKKIYQTYFPFGKGPASADIAYEIFLKNNEPKQQELIRQTTESRQWREKPLLNIVTAVFSPPVKIFEETIQSVLCQTYERWIWTIVDASSDQTIWRRLEKLAAADARICPIRLPENTGISGNLNVAFQQATGDYIVMLDHDDTLAPHALYSVARTILDHPDADFIYSDADKLDELGRRCEPLFKPDWSPEMMLCCNLLNQISVFRRTLLREAGELDPVMDGAQDWDLYLRITEKTDRVYHIPQILYHWRKSPQSCAQWPENKPYAKGAQLNAIKKHLTRSGRLDPRVTFVSSNPIQCIHPISSWELAHNPLVSVIVPSTDQIKLLDRCVDGLLNTTKYKHLEILIVDTASQRETYEFYRKYDSEPRIKILRNDPPFNFSKACNVGARQARGTHLLFLNNDIEVVSEDWLERMLQWFEMPGVGIVGAKLLYASRKIQHAGIIVGLGGLAAHLFLGAEEHRGSIFGSDDWYRNLSAVTAACMLIKREAFERTGGFNEDFRLSFSDVELCLRVRKLGYRIVYTPQARLIHHESETHKGQIPRSDFELANQKLDSLLKSGDPFFNPNLSYRTPLPLFRTQPEDTSQNTNDFLMKHIPNNDYVSLPFIYPQRKAGR